MAVVMLALPASVLFPSSPKAAALSGSQFNAGRIIDDFVFSNKNTMSPQDIQNFLNAKVPNCDYNGTQNSTHWNGGAGRYYTRAEWGALNGESAPFVCLKDYWENPTTKANNLHFATIAGGGKPASQLIWEVAQEYNINPQILLVLLQKEQSLVTDDWPWTTQYRSATGYGCPDTAPCDAQYYGFYNQISNAAWQFKYYAANPNSYNFRAQRNNYIGYNPNASCGGTTVFIQNQATAGLYIYTPYQPNAAALNNLYDSGDGCSAYGNRNFWRMFNDWFGPTYANDTNTPHPNGTLITDGSIVYLLDSGTRRPIRGISVFNSYNFRWSEVKPASSGDYNLPVGAQLPHAPGTLMSGNDGIYIMGYFDGILKKQHLSYHSYVTLGYSASDILYMPPQEVPYETEPGIYFSEKHPAGTIVTLYGEPNLYMVGEDGNRHAISPLAFDTNRLTYNKIKGATLTDRWAPVSYPYGPRQGAILFSNGIYVVDYDVQGVMKRPVGPWECYADRWRYSWADWYTTPPAALPERTGPLATC
jgi:hypothetical protein